MSARFATAEGYMTASVRTKFINWAISKKLMPNVAHRMPDIVGATPAKSGGGPIHFWQLFSILGERPILAIIDNFYTRVFAEKDDHFRRAFSDIGDKRRHVHTQAAMWLDCFGGGKIYHGGEYRLNFHHSHNAMQVMNRRGAELWIAHMESTLDEACGKGGVLLKFLGNDEAMCARVRRSINTFLGYFMDDYASKFNFSYCDGSDGSSSFGERNEAITLESATATATSGNSNVADGSSAKVQNLLSMSEAQIREMRSTDLRASLIRHKVDVRDVLEREDLIKRALRL